MQKIGIIVATTRENRVGLQVGEWVLSEAQQQKLNYELIDLKAINLPLLDEPFPPAANNYQHQHTKDWSQLIAGFSGFIIVTGEYNHGYPAPLKNALDSLFLEWNDKPVGFVSYGYSNKGQLAVEQLQAVVNNLKMRALQPGLALSLVDDFADGKLKVTSAMQVNLQQIFAALA